MVQIQQFVLTITAISTREAESGKASNPCSGKVIYCWRCSCHSGLPTDNYYLNAAGFHNVTQHSRVEQQEHCV